ncbi:hypothetical protein HMPREF1141_2359 [Clostridium sp. MSTE9]|nr:hypothetical protein HMPREF1141_2359 [Clostridium sp. MSTE9]
MNQTHRFSLSASCFDSGGAAKRAQDEIFRYYTILIQVWGML